MPDQILAISEKKDENNTIIFVAEATKFDLLLLIMFCSLSVMNTFSQMTGYYLFKWFSQKNRSLSIVTGEADNTDDPDSELIMI